MREQIVQAKQVYVTYIQKYSNGKLHILHNSYFTKKKDNHFKQATLISKFASDSLAENTFSGNPIVLLDRCYISDIIYGLIGYGDTIPYKTKLKNLAKIFKILTKNKDVKVSFIYCRPSKSAFDTQAKRRASNQ